MLEVNIIALPDTKANPDFLQGSIFFVGTATVLLRYAGFTILTDPNFLHSHDQIYIGYGLHTRRVTNPAMEIEDLPPLDLVILSHLHEDHFDRLVAEKLDKNVPIVTTHEAAAKLGQKGFRQVHALDTWECIAVKKNDATLRITAMPGKHAAGILSNLMPPVMGSMLEFITADNKIPFRIYITGDTLINDDLTEIPRRYQDIDLALLHLGGTKVMGLLLTMDAKQGVEAVKLFHAKVSVPIHYNDYEVFKSPLEDFKQAVNATGLQNRVHYVNHGDTYTFNVPQNRL